MNLRDLLERLWRSTGYPDTGSAREDGRYQDYKDFLNAAQDEIARTCSPKLFSFTRRGSIALVAGTQDYTLDDWTIRPLSLFTIGDQAREVVFRRARNADIEFLRNTSYAAVFGDYTVTDAERSADPYASGIAGATTGVTGVEGAYSATFGSAVTLTALWVGRMLRFNGEDGDYKILTINNTTKVATLDRPIVSRMSGVGATGVGAGYAAATCSWVVGPKGRYKISFLPAPDATDTVYYRYMSLPRKLLSLSEESELNTEYHDLIWKGALQMIGVDKESDALQGYVMQYQEALESLRKSELDEYVSTDAPRFITPYRRNRFCKPGVYQRGAGDW